jgi:hypothetical protein
MAGITEEDVLEALDVPRTAMEVSEMLPGLAVWNYERVRQRLLALERQGRVHRVLGAGQRNQRWSRAA